jgi:hypothetical protein
MREQVRYRLIIAQCLVRALVVVKPEAALQCQEDVESAGEVVGTDPSGLERAPQPFN